MQPMINALLDPVVNFGKVTVLGGHTDSTDDNVVTLVTGDGSKLPNPVPSGSFNLVWFNNSTYSDPADDPNVEIVRCIARVDDMLWLIRAQEGTPASAKNIPTKIYKMILSPTKKTIDDIGVESQSKVNTHSLLSTGVHGIGGDTIDGVSARNIAIFTHSSATSNVHGFNASGDAPPQTHGISRHTGTIGTWADIDKTTSSIVDITTRSHTSLTDIGTNTHATIDTAILNSTTHIGTTIAHGVTSDIVGISDMQTLANKTLTSPFISTIYGGTGTTSDLTLQTTSGVGTTGADMHFLVGNNGATEAMTILNSGNVGIGATNPGAKLDVNGDIRGTVSEIDGRKLAFGTDYRYGLAMPVAGQLHLMVHSGIAGAGQGIHFSKFDGISTYTTDMIINQMGYVGIGTANPQGKLHINVGTDQNFVFRSVSSIARLEATNDAFSGDVPIEFSATQFNFVNGNVGIEMASPTAKLHIGGTAGVDGIKFPDGTIQTTAAASSARAWLSGTDVYHAHDAQTYITPFLGQKLKAKTITLNHLPNSTLRIYYEMREYYGTPHIAYGQIYRNGVAVGTESSTSSTSFIAFIGNIAGWAEGDTLELWIWRGAETAGIYVRNLRILYNNNAALVNS